MLRPLGQTLIRRSCSLVTLLAFLTIVLSLPAPAYAATLRGATAKVPHTAQTSPSTFQNENLGGNWDNQSSPNAAVSWGYGRVDQFIVGQNNQLYHYWLDPTPHIESWGGNWASQDGLNASRLAAVSWGAPRLDVFLVGNDGHLYHYWQNGGNVYNLEELPIADTLFPPDSYIAATTWGAGRLDVFLVGYNDQLYHYWQNGNNTFSWTSLGGNYGGEAPAAVSWGAGRLDVFITGNNGMVHYWQQRSLWQINPPFSQQTILLNQAWVSDSPPTVVSWGTGRLDLFAYVYGANSDQLYHAWSQGGVAFGEEALPLTLPTFAEPNVKAVTWGVGRLDVFSIGVPAFQSDPLYHLWQINNNPFGIETIDNNVTTYNELSATTWGPGRLDVFACEGTVYDGSGTPLYHFWQG